MKLAFLHADLPPESAGGVAYQVNLLAREMTKRHDLTVFITVPSQLDRPFRVATSSPRQFGQVSKIFGLGLAFRRLDLQDFDVVHAHGDSWAVNHPAVVRTFYGTAAAEAVHAVSARRRVGQTVQYGLELVESARAKYRTTVSHHTRRFLPRIDRVIPCGVDPNIFFPRGERFDRPTVLLVAGRLGGRKRGRLALDAFRFARERIPDARMIIVSRDSVQEPGVECRGPVTDEEMGDLYSRSWALCSASSYEGFGLPYAEALLSGLPVVTTRNPGAEEILRTGGGVLVRDGDLGPALTDSLIGGPPPRPTSPHPDAYRFRIDQVADAFDDVYRLICPE